MKKLTPAQNSELKFLRGIVDRLEGEAYRTSPVPDAEKLCEWTETKRLPNLRERADE